MKFNYTDKEVIEKYKELKYLNKTAKFFRCNPKTIKRKLDRNNIKTLNNKEARKLRIGRSIEMYDLSDNYIRTFDSIMEASEYLIETKVTSNEKYSVCGLICNVCKNNRNKCYSYKWKYKE